MSKSDLETARHQIGKDLIDVYHVMNTLPDDSRVFHILKKRARYLAEADLSLHKVLETYKELDYVSTVTKTGEK